MQKIIPAITGVAWLDSLLRGLLYAAAGALATLVVPLLLKYGITDPKALAAVPTLLFALLLIGASMVWSHIRNIQVVKVMLDQAIAAADYGEVPMKLQAVATPEQFARIDSINTKRAA